MRQEIVWVDWKLLHCIIA